MNVELANQIDEQLLNEVLSDEKYEWIKSYDIHIKMFYKYGKYDKDGNLKTPALKKMGKPILLSIKIVSSFNRLTDDVDVKILINKDLWDSYSIDERKSSLDGVLNYLELKTDKIGEPIPISEDNDKVQLKLKYPDFFCEGFISLVEKYGNNYIPIQEAKAISDLLKSQSNNIKKEHKEKKIKDNKFEESDLSDEDNEVNLDDIKI